VKRARRIIRITLVGAGILIALAVLFAAFVLFTTPGAKLALRIASGRELPARAGSIEGALAKRFILRDVELKIGPVEASIDTVMVVWRPLALRDHRVDVTEVTVAGARIVVSQDSAASKASESPRDSSQVTRWILAAERVRVRNATVEAPGDVHLRDVDIVASGGLDGYRADIRASGSVWRFSELSAFVRASGNASAATADSLEVRTLGGIVRGDAFVRWEPDLSWRGRLEGDSLRVGELADTPDDWLGAVSFRAKGTGLLHEDSTRVGIDVQSLDGMLRNRPVSARARVDIETGRIEASDAWVRWGSAQATLSGSMAEVADVRLDARIPSLGEILPRARGSASVRGRLTGSPERIEVDLDATGRDLRAGRFDIPKLEAALDAALSADSYVPHGADIRRADIRVGEGRLKTRGKISWQHGIEWDAAVAADRFEISTLTPARWNVHGPVSMTATSSGRRRGNDLRGRVAIDSLSGTIRDRPLRGSGKIALERGVADVSALYLEWGETRARVDGVAGDTLNLDFDIASSNLAAFDSSFAGSLSLQGEVRGPRKRPVVKATVTADSVRVREYAVHRLDGEVDADLAFASPADVHLLALGAARGETVFDTVRVEVSGPRDGHRASVSVVQGETRAALALRGAYADSTWAGWIEDVRFRHKVAGEWQSADRAPVFLSPSRVHVDSLSLASESARLSARVHWQRGDSTRAQAELHGFELARFQPYWVEGMKVTGVLEGTIAVSGVPGQGFNARIDVVPGPGEIVFAGKSVEYRGRATGRADATGVFAEVDLDVDQTGAQVATVNAKMSIPGFVLGRDSLGTQPLEGGIDVDCRNIGPVLTVFAPRLARSSGVLTVHMTPTGTAGNFRMTGRAALEDARIDLPSGVRLRDTDLELLSDGKGQVTLDGAVTSGGGRVVLQASSARSEKGWVNGTFTAQGERFQVINQPEAQVFVSPDVEVRIEERTATVTGRVFVPFARIETTQVPASAASRSSDVVFVEDTLATKPALKVQTQLRVELGDSVSFSGFGLSGRLAGSLAVNDESGRPTQGTGEIQIVDGKYRAFGNELTIDPGRFVFGGGAIDNPGLDVRAYRGLTAQQNVMTGSGEIVGVNLRGTLRRPEFSVFSNPPMSESEIMSYLVLGRPMSSSGDQSALASAALLYGMQQGTNVAGGIGKRFALDDAYVEGGSEAKETAFVAGKYLSPKLYVSYAAGLFEHTNTFRARYSLTHRWTLQAESGKDSSTDLLYWFERGK
jgi:translocation and assembly module TamB